jgi:hypothetical protein
MKEATPSYAYCREETSDLWTGGQQLGLEKVMKDGRQEEEKKRLIMD